MKRAITSLAIATLLSIATPPSSARADDAPPDNWGSAPNARGAHPDAKGRSGHWWWPKRANNPKATGTHSGNKGKIYGRLSLETSPTEMIAAVPPPTVYPQPPIVSGHVILNNLLFQLDSVELRPEGIAEIQKVIAEMQKYPGDTVTCVGHTDDSGSETSNQQLGLRRAQAVVDYMKASGVAPERVSAISKGETEPAVPNDTPGNRAVNRRVVFQYKIGN